MDSLAENDSKENNVLVSLLLLSLTLAQQLQANTMPCMEIAFQNGSDGEKPKTKDSHPEQEINEDTGSQRMLSAGIVGTIVQDPEFQESSDYEGKLELQQGSRAGNKLRKSIQEKYFWHVTLFPSNGTSEERGQECKGILDLNFKMVPHPRDLSGERTQQCDSHKHSQRQNTVSLINQLTNNEEKPSMGGAAGICHLGFDCRQKIKLYKCYQCGKTFGGNLYLIRHQKIHSGERCYECKECGKTFNQNSVLAKHQRIHVRGKPFECHECGKAFRRISALTDHQRVHTGEKPYECKECGKKFRGRADVTYHQRTHSGKKLYECKECGKAFMGSSDLSKHHGIHSGKKPYECKECGKAFIQSSDLSKHLQIFSGEKPYECKECGKAFTFSSGLSEHQRIHRGDKPYEYLEGKASGQPVKVSTKTFARWQVGEVELPIFTW
ncbi:zinc finger protein 23-like [Gracilinanus agilis]|uniref:zinc finger protein 23-like n=1 Tax=Gracilinanus agilis TaxID=191870 RepID=UPI001CFDA3E7|nr:zinc finger protein 23-like [Gracilinanus agilis]